MRYLRYSSEAETEEVRLINLGFFTMEGFPENNNFGAGQRRGQGQNQTFQNFSGFPGGQGQSFEGFSGFPGGQGQSQTFQGFPGGQPRTGSTNVNPEAFKQFFKQTQKQK